jgi:hypothetical protein
MLAVPAASDYRDLAITPATSGQPPGEHKEEKEYMGQEGLEELNESTSDI